MSDFPPVTRGDEHGRRDGKTSQWRVGVICAFKNLPALLAMRTRRSASPAAAASPGDLGGGVLASIPSLPSSSSRPSVKGSGGGTAKTRRTSSRSSSAPAAAPTAKNATDVEDEDTPTSTATGTVTGRPRSARATKASNGKAKTQRSASESRSRRQATKSSTSTSSNANSGARKKSQEATPTDAAIASRPSLKVSAKENIDDAAVGADDVHGALDDVPDATTKDTGTEKEPEQPETMSANGNSVATTSTATDDADPTSPTKVKTCTTNSKGNRGGLPPKPVNSGAVTTTAGATKSSSATASKRKAVPSKFAGGGKPPTVRNGKPPTPRNNSIAGNASAGDDDKSAAGTAAAAAATHATKRTTFLSGYNLDCTKTSSLLDLPDPPTPEGDDDDGNGSSLQDRKAKRRRRMSTGAAAFGSRRSIGTPGGGNGMGTGDDANLGNKSTSDRGDGVAVGAAAPRSIVFDDLSARARRDGGKSQRRKVRNSLCHVPSPAETSTMPSSTGNDTGTSDNVEINGQSKRPDALQSPDKKSASTDADKAQDVDDKASPVETGGLCFDDDDDDDDDDNNATGDDSTTKKRRKKQQQRSSRSKKRQSVFLPSDFMHLSSASGRQSGVGASIEGNDANEFYSDLLSYKASATSTASADSSMSLCSNASVGSNIDANDGKVTAAEQPSALREDPNTSNLLLQAVREICSLPESKRYDSDQAGVVELLGGYPYIPPAEKVRMKACRSRNQDAKKMAAGEKGDGDDLNWTFSPSTPGPKPADDPPMSPVDPIAATLEKRRELILTLGPVVERMEAKRKEDTEAARQATGCRVSRTKKGRYKYYDLDTDEEVSPEEYKRRYFAMISGNRGGDQDQSSDSAPSPVAQGKTEEENAPVAKKTDSGHTRDLQDEGLEEESSTHEMSIDEDGDDMDISLMSMQGVEDVVSKDAVAGDMGNGSVNENDSLNIESNASSTDMRGDEEVEAEEEKIASPAPGKPKPPPSSSSSDFILPLPDRGDPDTDPQIAAAERRLWSDIDAALARYSRDVISIRAARKMGFTLSQTAESP